MLPSLCEMVSSVFEKFVCLVKCNYLAGWHRKVVTMLGIMNNLFGVPEVETSIGSRACPHEAVVPDMNFLVTLLNRDICVSSFRICN